ncbi:pirin family protein [Pseudoalteromonas luteoviolacea]|uniref:pirin family protein n=1 Tax=Pseudoalteromonas luteoviolacea TaxID=43657 RepID=UPI001B36E9A0|nr:pirin family protein [Pseudoalteromonas luteoviolacea]MBQ4810146.1 pirin family protein [Pseudoalteromonas luteoviolacea]
MAQLLTPTKHELGGLNVQRLLPHMKKRMVGPFIFFDHMGPTQFSSGRGVDVQPHPHIGLSTLTYLIEGSLLHRDSLGNHIEITPGDVNWMTAGAGIVHSERESFETRAQPHTINGLQSWIALPKEHETVSPNFEHFNRHKLPQTVKGGVMKRVIAGQAYGLTSPVKTYSPMFYVDIIANNNSDISLPSDTQETALYIIWGEIRLGKHHFKTGDFMLIDDLTLTIEVVQDARFILLGGDKWERVPYIHWNFVSFSKERIEQAKLNWQNNNFPQIPDDNLEYVPLPVKQIRDSNN